MAVQVTWRSGETQSDCGGCGCFVTAWAEIKAGILVTRLCNGCFEIVRARPEVVSGPATGTLCSVCRGPQYRSPSGVTCGGGHGEAPPLVVCRDCGEQKSDYIHRLGDNMRDSKDPSPPLAGAYHEFVSYMPGPASELPAESKGRRLPPPEAMNGYADQFGGEDYPTFTAKPDEGRHVPRESSDDRVLSVFMYPNPACGDCGGLGICRHRALDGVRAHYVRVICDCVRLRKHLTAVSAAPEAPA